MIFTRISEYEIPSTIDSLIADLQGKGLGGNIVRDTPEQLSPPEAALWTGKEYQLAFCRSGLNVWLELRHTTPLGKVAIRQTAERNEYTLTVAKFCTKESELP